MHQDHLIEIPISINLLIDGNRHYKLIQILKIMLLQHNIQWNINILSKLRSTRPIQGHIIQMNNEDILNQFKTNIMDSPANNTMNKRILLIIITSHNIDKLQHKNNNMELLRLRDNL